MQLLSIILKVVSIGWMILSAMSFHMPAPWWMGFVFAFLGVITLGLGLYLTREPAHALWGHDIAIPRIELDWLLISAGVASFFLLSEINGQVFDLPYNHVHAHAQFSILILGIVSVSVGFAGRWHITWRPRLDISLLIVTLLALVLRIWQLETAVHFFVDELNFGRAVWRASYLDFVPLAAPFSETIAFPWLYPYFQLWGVQVFGFDLLALRFVSVIIGTLTIPAVYWLTAEMFNRRVALLAAVLLATFPPHVHFSRLGINNVADPLFGVLALWFLVRALKHQRQVDYVLGGVMLGLTQYFYEGGRVFYPIMILVWLEVMAIFRLVRLDAPVARRIGLFAMTAGIVAMPVYYTLLATGGHVLRRFDTAGIGGSYYQVLAQYDVEQTFWEHLTLPFRIYLDLPELSLFYGGNQPLLLVWAVPAFLLGIGYALWRLQQPAALLLVLWIVGTSAGSVLMTTSAYAARFVVAFPALVILMGVGLYELFAARRQWLAVGLVSVIALIQVNYYFNEHLPVYNMQLRPVPDVQDAVFRAADFPQETTICLVSNEPFDEALIEEMRDFVAPQIHLCFLTSSELTSGKIPAGDSAAYFVERHDEDSIAYLIAHHDNLEGPLASPYTTVPESRQFLLFHTPFLR